MVLVIPLRFVSQHEYSCMVDNSQSYPGTGTAQWYSTGLRARISGVRVLVRAGIFFFFTTASRPALEPTRPPIQWTPEALSLGVKRPVREAEHSPPSSAEVKVAWSYTSTPPICLHGEVLS
jgi:hypothetical protein